MSFAAAFFVSAVSAQVIRKVDGPAGEIFDIPELSALIIGGEKELRVDFVAPKDMRLKGYENLDVREGDAILFFNGKRVKTIAALKEAYETTATADTAKIGIRRDSEMFFVSFKKADPKTLPRRKIVITNGPEGAPGKEGGTTTRTMTFKSGGDFPEGSQPILELGILAGVANKKVKVLQRLLLPGAAPEVDLQPGDVLEMLNGKTFSTPDELVGLLEKIPTGEKIDLKYARGEKSLSAAFAKPEPRGKVMIRKME